MASSIGGTSVISIEGLPDRPGQKTENISAPFRSGNARRRTHVRGGERTIVATVDTQNLTTANTLETTFKAMEGTIVDIIKDGITYSDYMVCEVETQMKQQGAIGVGGVYPNGSCVCKFAFLVEDAAVPA